MLLRQGGGTPCHVDMVTTMISTPQWQRNRNTIGGAGVRGCEAADYPHEASAYEGQELPPSSTTLGTPLPCMLSVKGQLKLPVNSKMVKRYLLEKNN